MGGEAAEDGALRRRGVLLRLGRHRGRRRGGVLWGGIWGGVGTLGFLVANGCCGETGTEGYDEMVDHLQDGALS
jgi:hypothetical protein